MGLKDFYYSLEDKYYALLDKIDSHLPVYKVVDPIDKVVPSFALALVVIALIVALLAFSLGGFNPLAQEKTTLTITVIDDAGVPLKNVELTISGLEATIKDSTNSKGQKVLADIEMGKTLTITLKKANYGDATESVTVTEKNQEKTITLTATALPSTTRFVEFRGPDGKKLSGKTLTAEFSCSSGTPIENALRTITSGETTVVVPGDCGNLVARVSGTGFKTNSFTLNQGGVISLEAENIPKGTVLFRVKDIETKRALSGINLKVYSLNNQLKAEKTTSFGEAVFSLEAGDYYVVAEDPNEDYASETKNFEVSENDSKSEEILLGKEIKAYIKVFVKDKANNAIIPNATVFLKKDDGSLYGQKATDENEGKATFTVSENGIYYIEAAHDSYLYSDANKIDTRSVSVGATITATVKLEKLTAANSGRLNVTVVDEDNWPVENATVNLFDANSGFLCSGCGQKTTDVNGVAKFSGIKKGKYYALAYKYPAQGTSDAKDIDNRIENELTVNLIIGNGTIQVKAVDLDNKAIPFATAELRTETGEALGAISLDAQGIGSKTLKADKKVYVKVSADGYSSWTSASRQIMPNKTVTVTAKLEEEILGDKPTVEFLGLYSTGSVSSQMQQLNSGEEVTARFLLKVPSETSFSEIGLHVRAGADETKTVQKDQLFINGVNAPYASSLKSTTYNASNGTAIDEENITNGDAKWVNIWWHSDSGIEPGVYNLEIQLKVKNNTTQGYELPLHYRAWGVDSGEAYLRDPIDTALGTASDSGAKEALYAQTYDKTYYEGIPDVCSEDFCYSERVIDGREGSILSDAPYPIRMFDDYNVVFAITNNSGTLHDNANIRVKSTTDGIKTDDVVSIKQYSLVNADSSNFSSSAPKFEIDPIDLGYFATNKTIMGSMVVQAKKEEQSSVQLTVVSSQNTVFEKIIDFQPYSEQDINVTVLPDVLASMIALELKVHAEYEGGEKDGFPLRDAIVRVTRTAPDLSQTTMNGATDAQGNAVFSIPASSNGTKIKVEVEKPGYGSKAIEKTVGEGIIKFNPNEMKFSLNLTNRQEKESNLTITNLIPPELTISKLKVTGRFYGLLDEERMNNYLQQFIGLDLNKSHSETIKVLAALSDNAQLLDESTIVKGNLIVNATDETQGSTWSFNVPLEVDIGLAEMCKYNDPISISVKEWKGSTLDNKIMKEFLITNNCVNDDDEVMNVANLKARIKWRSDAIGNVELTINDPSGGSYSQVLQETIWARYFNEVEGGKQYVAIATFTPNPGHLGETAAFDIEIDAELLTDRGRQDVGATNAIQAELLVINLEQCIKYSPQPQEGIKISRSEKETSFELDTSECGDIALDFKFCDNDNCRGGTSEGGIYLRPTTLSNVMPDDPKTVTVERGDIPGFYGIPVSVRPPGGSFRQVAEMEAIIEPQTGKYFTLDRYDFTIIGKGSKDSTTLNNQMLQEPVAVTADMCAWGDATSNSNFGLAVGAGAATATLTAFTSVGAASAVSFSIGIGGFNGLVLAGSWCPPCIIAGIAVMIAVMLFMGDDCHDSHQTNTLTDYVIYLVGSGTDRTGDRFLPADAQSIILDNEKIKASWNLEARDIYAGQGANGTEEVGVVFENLGLEEQQPTYSIGTIQAKEHVHGDVAHAGNAKVDCGNGNFGNYWIGASGNQGSCKGANDTTHSQKFHLRFKTSDINESLPAIPFDAYACSSGTEFGLAGVGALPKIKFNWNWDEDTGGIAYNGCDQGNDKAIYCDATQFSIELNKRLINLEEFFRGNNYDFTCPAKNDGSAATEEYNNENSTHNVGIGSLGLSKIESSLVDNTATVKVTVKNGTGADQNAYFKVTLNGTNVAQQSCDKEVLNLAAGATGSGECVFTGLSEATYAVVAQISSASTSSIDSSTVSSTFLVGDPLGLGGVEVGGCWAPRTTETLYGEPMIKRFIEADSSIHWTAAINNPQALYDTLKFNAYLIKDGYTDDFQNDFVKYYTEQQFADTDARFTGYGFDKYFESDNLFFTQKYVESPQLPAAGVYEVEIAAYFGDNWRFVKENGELAAGIGVVFYRLDDPTPNSPFYSMPFDGLVGYENGAYNRQGYGVSYNNASTEEMLQINRAATPVKSYDDTGSNAVLSIDSAIERDFYELNTSPDSRGAVLIVDKTKGNAAKLTLQPAYATPVMLKLNHGLDTEPFGAFYIATETDVPVDTGSVLAYWSGAGSCLDFSGVPVTEIFTGKPDRQATTADRGVTNWMAAFGVGWEKADYAGDVYLRTIFYTNPKKQSTLKVESPLRGLSFYTPDQSGSGVSLNGISSMPYNRPGAGSADSIGTMEDVFGLVENGQMCVTNSGNKTKFWWNPQTIYLQQGTARSIHEMTMSLVGGVNCIGYDSEHN
ncbi:MAG: hypothetical protein V1494_00130 [Candidatus Diapherotrites archaeon]